MTTQSPAPRHNQWLWTSFLAVGFIAIVVYLGYSIYTQTGLGGYLIALQFKIFGAASFKMTFLAGMIILMIAATPVVWLAEKLLSKVIGPEPYVAVARAAVVLNTAPKDGYSWKWILVAGSAPLVLGAVVAAALFLIDQHDRKQTVYTLELTDGPPVLPEGAKFVEIKGLVKGRYLAGYKERPTAGSDYDLHLFAPITGPNWTVADPVQFILHRTTKGPPGSWNSAGRDGQALPDSFTRQGMVTSSGKLGGTLPVIVGQSFKSKGISIAPSVLVIDWTELADRQIPASDSYLVAFFVGAAFSLVTFIIMPIVKLGEYVRKKRQLRQVS
jgi:hypothetical protein